MVFQKSGTSSSPLKGKPTISLYARENTKSHSLSILLNQNLERNTYHYQLNPSNYDYPADISCTDSCKGTVYYEMNKVNYTGIRSWLEWSINSEGMRPSVFSSLSSSIWRLRQI